MQTKVTIMGTTLVVFLISIFVVLSPTLAQQESEPSCTTDYVVQANDSLSKIAEKTYGDKLAYPVIFEATNAKAAIDDSYATLDDPNRIEIGQKLCLLASTSDAASTELVSEHAPGPAIPTPAPTIAPPDLVYNMPADVSVAMTEATQADFDVFSWQTFLAINAAEVGGPVDAPGNNNPTQWRGWSSTADMLNSLQNMPQPPPSGSIYYPPICQNVPNYENYRVLDEVDKINDSLFEANHKGLSSDPLVVNPHQAATTNHFVRYEILLSPATYNWISDTTAYSKTHLSQMAANKDKVNFVCGTDTYTEGDPANPDMGSLILKLAWMEVDPSEVSNFYTEDLLVYTPAYFNTDSQTATCELQTMGLVGMHIVHKTEKQPSWIWSTFEHKDNAPDCTEAMPAPQNYENIPNTSCPATVDQDYNFYPQQCNEGEACQLCNTAPLTNASTIAGSPDCKNPDTETGAGWCVNQVTSAAGVAPAPPNPDRGTARLCRQVPREDYDQAANDAYVPALEAAGSIWANYELISTQWSTATNTIDQSCSNVSATIRPGRNVDHTAIRPQVRLSDGKTTRPFLANTSMESYERSNCMGCHSAAKTNFDSKVEAEKISSDFVFFLGIEVPAEPDN